MSKWRVIVVALLTVGPFGVLAGIGSWYLWTHHLGFAFWWVMAGCLCAGYLLGWYWQHKRRLLRPPSFDPPLFWTERDKRAWELIKARAEAATRIDPDKLTDLNFYTDQARDMAQELAAFYNPGAEDPVGALTIPELLAVVELASQDLAQMMDRYVPGGHLLTINDLRLARKIPDWYQSASNVYWVIAALFDPVGTGLRYAASQVGLSQPFHKLHQNLLIWFYTAYVHRLGTYLVELNSGRLRIGVPRYRELLQRQLQPDGQTVAPAPAAPAPAPAEDVRRVTITLMGQVKAGKSSVVNALLGEQRAKTDVLPATAEVTRYELQPEGIPTRLVLLDTVGFAHTGPKEDQLRATREAAQHSDLLLLVLHARNPARQADLSMLEGLRKWFADRPDLKMPRVLAVLTHIDLLSPAMDWSPPYNWERPQRAKEKSIDAAAAAVREQLGEHLVGVVPVCAAPGKVCGVDEWLLPALAELLDEAHAVGLLRVLRIEFDTEKVRKVIRQMKAVALEAGKLLWRTLTAPAPPKEKPPVEDAAQGTPRG
ncbi:MAG TPA: GTPase [Gemmataceae bacterium]|nr:GTPase [Gemmataceae bacterium]